MKHFSAALCAVFLLGLTAGGCRKNPPPQAPLPTTSSNTTMMASSTEVSDDAAERAAAARREAERIRDILQNRIHFDYDMADIRDDARRILDEKVSVLRTEPTIRLRIEGHADERGSTEYNIALGTRRATSVVNYFGGFGIDAIRFQTLSYGEERPLLEGQGEGAWSQNRRAEFIVTAGPILGSSPEAP